MSRAKPDPEPTAERLRLAEREAGLARWDRWGPYLSERQWGTVREASPGVRSGRHRQRA